uniref:Uncharacterized protein n=1 Tax=viral metagenome TaxID=1070528 RepID=A0A6C0BNT3_9ZZZZ
MISFLYNRSICTVDQLTCSSTITLTLQEQSPWTTTQIKSMTQSSDSDISSVSSEATNRSEASLAIMSMVTASWLPCIVVIIVVSMCLPLTTNAIWGVILPYCIMVALSIGGTMVSLGGAAKRNTVDAVITLGITHVLCLLIIAFMIGVIYNVQSRADERIQHIISKYSNHTCS